MFNIKRKIKQFIIKTVVEDMRLNGSIRGELRKYERKPGKPELRLCEVKDES